MSKENVTKEKTSEELKVEMLSQMNKTAEVEEPEEELTEKQKAKKAARYAREKKRQLKFEEKSEKRMAKGSGGKSSLNAKRMRHGYLFILPWLIGFIVFYVKSLFQTVQFSLSELTVQPTGGYKLTFVGLDNFLYAFRVDPEFKQILTSSIGNMLIDVPLIIFFSLFMALLLNKKFKGRTLVRAIFFLPVILNADAITAAMELSRAMMTGGISSSSAEAASAAQSSGISVEYYMRLLSDLALPTKVLEYIAGAVGRISDIITASGVQIIIFIAALQSIPGSMYEVAKIEGATGYETFWKVTFPMVMPHIITNVVYTVVDSFTKSDVVDLAYRTAFDKSKYGLSAAFSLVSMLITILILLIVVRLIQKKTFYYN